MQRDRDDERGFAGRPLAVDSRWTQAGSARSDELAAARSEELAASEEAAARIPSDL